MEKAIQKAKEYFDNLSKEEFMGVLIEAGFNVTEGTGKIIFTDETYVDELKNALQ